MLRYMNREGCINKYMIECRQFDNNPEKYTLYVHGFLLPWFDEQREAKNLQKGKKVLMIISYCLYRQDNVTVRWLTD